MLAPAKPDDENTPIPALNPLVAPPPDAIPDERFDGLARLARRHFGVPVALIVADRQQPRFKSCLGASWSEMPRFLSFIKRIDFGNELLVVPDTLADARFSDHPLVVDNPCIRFYAGCRLAASNGTTLGGFCLVDTKPRALDDEARDYLRDLARLASAILEHDRIEAARKEDVDALRESERRMALAIAGSGTGIWDRNIQTNEIHYSAGWKAILGYADSELTNLINDSYKRVHPDDLDYVQATIQAHFNQKN